MGNKKVDNHGRASTWAESIKLVLDIISDFASIISLIVGLIQIFK